MKIDWALWLVALLFLVMLAVQLTAYESFKESVIGNQNILKEVGTNRELIKELHSRLEENSRLENTGRKDGAVRAVDDVERLR